MILMMRVAASVFVMEHTETNHGYEVNEYGSKRL